MKKAVVSVLLAWMVFLTPALKADPSPVAQPTLAELQAAIFEGGVQAQPDLPETMPAPELRHDVTCGGDYCSYTSCACHVECDNDGLLVVYYKCYPRMEHYTCTCG